MVTLFGPTLKRNYLSHNFFILLENMNHSDFVHFFEDGTKLKMPFEITPPLTKYGSKVKCP